MKKNNKKENKFLCEDKHCNQYVDLKCDKSDEPNAGIIKKNKLFKTILLMIFVLSTSIYLSLLILQSAQDILGLNKKDIQVQLNIPKGSSTNYISQILKEKGIIENALSFKIYSKLKKTDGKYMHGTYILSSKMSYEEIIDAFQNTNKRTDIIKLTIPEGYTINQIANLLEENKVCTKEKFLESVESDKFNNEFLSRVTKNEMIRYILEGYLFPDTYTFTINQKPSFVIQTMLDNFESKVYKYQKGSIQKSKMNLTELMTMASIIQAESTNLDIMKLVSSVFHNRINNPTKYPNLQSDATIFYVERNIKPTIEFTNQKMYDSYNTYVRKGLPIGPICNPGLDAIQAALNPDDTDYFYFLTDCENNYYWAKTLNEHNQNLYIAERLGLAKGIATDMTDKNK